MPDLELIGFFDLLKRGTVIEVYAERFTYSTSTEILDSCPTGSGGVVLTLSATADEGQLELTEAMIAAAEDHGDSWTLHHEGLLFRFGAVESEPAFGPDGYFTRNPEAWAEHRDLVRERDARREATASEQRGRESDRHEHRGP